jgi:ankyrin repeat protein
LANGSSVLILDQKGNSLLHICAQNNLKKMAALLIRNGCPIYFRNKRGLLPVDYCTMYSFFEMREWLLNSCPDSITSSTSDNNLQIIR